MSGVSCRWPPVDTDPHHAVDVANSYRADSHSLTVAALCRWFASQETQRALLAERRKTPPGFLSKVIAIELYGWWQTL